MMVSGLTVDADHLDTLLGCVNFIRQNGQRPAIFLGDTKHSKTLAVARRIGCPDMGVRTIDAQVTLSPGPFAWSDEVPHVKASQTVQSVTNWRLLSDALVAEFGWDHPLLLDRGSLPADAVWLAVLRVTKLRIAAVLWPHGKSPTVYYGRTYSFTTQRKAA